MPQTDTPTPVVGSLVCSKNITKLLPCLQCLSEQELWAALAVVWSFAADVDILTRDGLSDAMDQAACLECLNDTELLKAEITVIAYAFADGQPEITQSISALSQQPIHRLKALIVSLMCRSTLQFR